MSDDKSVGLDRLPPHKRDLLEPRLEAIRKYVRDRTRENAERGAAELGLSMVHFKKLVSVWEAHGSADRLPGAVWNKPRRNLTAEHQFAIIEEASASVEDGTIEKVVRKARSLALQRGVALPSPVTIRARVKELRAGMEPDAFGHDADLVIDHCAIGLPVATPAGVPTMPVAALVIDVRARRVVGMALSLDGPDATTTACALLMTALNWPDPAQGRALRVAMDLFPGADWSSLATTIAAGDIEIVGSEREKLRRDVANRYLGDRPNGIPLHPRLVGRPAAQRRPRLASGQSPMSMAEAQDFAEAVLVGRAVRGEPIDGRLRALATRVAAWLPSGKR